MKLRPDFALGLAELLEERPAKPAEAFPQGPIEFETTAEDAFGVVDEIAVVAAVAWPQIQPRNRRSHPRRIAGTASLKAADKSRLKWRKKSALLISAKMTPF